MSKLPESNSKSSSPPAVLIVDDEELMRTVAGRILEQGGFSVAYAEDGDTALAHYRSATIKFSLVLLDLSMPGESGLEVFRRLKGIDPGVRVLFSSGYGDDERLRTARAEGAAGFLQKPYTMEKMMREVRRSISGSGDEVGL